jgi:hypothetical protein
MTGGDPNVWRHVSGLGGHILLLHHRKDFLVFFLFVDHAALCTQDADKQAVGGRRDRHWSKKVLLGIAPAL